MVRPPTAPRVFVEELMAWGGIHRRSFPWRENPEPFRTLVAEILLQRSRGTTVATVYEALFSRWPDADALARARVTSIESVIRPLGLTKRAATLRALAQEVTRLGSVPGTLDGLLALPGVGRYAASATLSVAFGTRAAVVDGVTARVYRRYFGLEGDEPATNDDKLWALVEEVTPHEHIREWNWAVLDLAATICLPKVPRCSQCPLQADCTWSRASA